MKNVLTQEEIDLVCSVLLCWMICPMYPSEIPTTTQDDGRDRKFSKEKPL
jgi:hypothetical protein